MEVVAKLNRLRMSPRKIRLVVGLIRRMPVNEAETQLRFLNKAAALPVLKLLQSAKANAEHNHKLDLDKLWISHITVDGGKTLKRWRPRAFGRAAAIRKRTSHITIKLSDDVRPPNKKKKVYVPRKSKAQKVAPKAKTESKPEVKDTKEKSST
jgi:large subunit ribosomal protein L22